MMMIRGVLLCQYNDRNTRHPIFLFSFYKHKTTPISLRKKKKTLETIANEGDLAPFNDYSENVEYYRIYLFIFSHRHIHSVSNLGMAANLTPQLPWPTKFHALLISDKEIGRILFSLSSLFRSSPWSGI